MADKLEKKELVLSEEKWIELIQSKLVKNDKIFVNLLNSNSLTDGIIKALIANKWNINKLLIPAKGYLPMYPLSLACCRRNYDIIKVMLENGAKVNQRDGDSETALESLFSGESPDNEGKEPETILKITKLLIQYGAVLETEDTYLSTFEAYRGKEGFDEILEQLKVV